MHGYKVARETWFEGVERIWLSEKQFGGGVGEAEALGRKLKSVRPKLAPTLVRELVDFVSPFGFQVKTGGAPELVQRPSGHHAQAEGGGFASAL